MSSTANDEKLIKVAVAFLNNPKVINAPDESKKQFLKKKGLNDEQIKKAFEKAKEEKEKKPAEEAKPEEKKPAASESKSAQDEGPTMTIEEAIQKAKETNALFIRKMNITSLPPTVFELTNLEILIINGVKLKNIPSDIAKLTNLKVFHAVGCGLFDNQFANEFYTLQNLEEVNLSKNKLTNISKIVELKNLVTLDVSENEIIRIPNDLDKLEKLESFNIRNNNLSIIPNVIGKMKRLRQFYVKGNNLDPKLEEVLKAKGFQGLVQYLNEDY